MHELKTEINEDKFAAFVCSRKVFISHSFYKWPLYTLQTKLSRLARFLET